MTGATRILIIDDEPTIRNVVRMSLEGEGYKIKEAHDGRSGITLAEEFHPHLLLLDLGLPDMNGVEVLKALRKWTHIPIIVLTVSDEEQTKVHLLDSGADDYLTKPFGTKELQARIRVALRKGGLAEATPVFVSGQLEVNLSDKKVWLEKKEIHLTNTEFEVLSVLVRNAGKVVSQTSLLKQIWAAASDDQSHYLRIYINQLRKKLELNPSAPKHILTEPGVGYKIV